MEYGEGEKEKKINIERERERAREGERERENDIEYFHEKFSGGMQYRRVVGGAKERKNWESAETLMPLSLCTCEIKRLISKSFRDYYTLRFILMIFVVAAIIIPIIWLHFINIW